MRRTDRPAERRASEGDFASFVNAWRTALISRRAFLAQAAATSAAALFPFPAAAAAGDKKAVSIPARLAPAQWRTLAAVQAHLFPAAPGSPGAADINALDYLRGVLDGPALDDDEKAFLVDGVGWLEDIAREQTGADFGALDAAQREDVLRRVERSSAGETWLANVLLYIFEALLCDPVYGGNPDGVGWAWLQHQPGFPRPPADKIYGRL